MKSDHLNFIDLSTTQEVEIEGLESEIEGMAERPGLEGFDVNPITAPPKRYTTRKIMVNELIAALRRALATEEKREKVLRVRGNNIVEIKRRDITERIEELYRRINDLLAAVKGKEVVFSKVVAEWKRGHIIDTFLPLIYLESQGRVRCRQDEVFDDIYISNEDENTKSKPMT
jgi:chromatin segregation and condensation protein Rec8/ScpA/Scc1 (kleisin family)